jgi:hypothetical protein
LSYDSRDSNTGIQKAIEEFDEGNSYLHDGTGAVVTGKTADDVKREVVRLSTTYGILTKYTALVAVEERDEATEGTMKLRKFGAVAPKDAPAPPVEPGTNRCSSSQPLTKRNGQ